MTIYYRSKSRDKICTWIKNAGYGITYLTKLHPVKIQRHLLHQFINNICTITILLFFQSLGLGSVENVYILKQMHFYTTPMIETGATIERRTPYSVVNQVSLQGSHNTWKSEGNEKNMASYNLEKSRKTCVTFIGVTNCIYIF